VATSYHPELTVRVLSAFSDVHKSVTLHSLISLCVRPSTELVAIAAYPLCISGLLKRPGQARAARDKRERRTGFTNLQRPRKLLCAVRVEQIVRFVVHEARFEDVSVEAGLVLHHLALPAASAEAIRAEAAARVAFHWMKQGGSHTFTRGLPTLECTRGQERRRENQYKSNTIRDIFTGAQMNKSTFRAYSSSVFSRSQLDHSTRTVTS